MRRTRRFVYIVRCRDGTLYTGTARDVAVRLAKHDCGIGARYTRSRGPVTLVWQEGPMTVSRALRREHQIKQLTRARKESLIRGNLMLKLERRKKRQERLSGKFAVAPQRRAPFNRRTR